MFSSLEGVALFTRSDIAQRMDVAAVLAAGFMIIKTSPPPGHYLVTRGEAQNKIWASPDDGQGIEWTDALRHAITLRDVPVPG